MFPKSWYKSPLFRAFLRGLRAAIAVGISAIIGALVEEPTLPLWLPPALLALDKYVRDKLK
jgi:hypothetical protein